MERNGLNEKIAPLIRLGAAGFWGQLAVLAAGIVIVACFGLPPENAAESFARYGETRFGTLLADDSYNIVLILLYVLTIPGLFFILKDHRFTPAFLAAITVVGTALVVPATHAGFSMMRLSDLYHSTGDPEVRERLLAAGEALIAGNLWNSSAGFAAGIFLQGGSILMCVAMIGHPEFRKITIISGIAGNGIDLLQHLIHPFLPGPSDAMKYVMGPFYLAWFVLAALDMTRIHRSMTTMPVNPGNG